MNYFEAHYEKLKFVHASEKQIGLRSAQIGAIYSLAAHFTTSKEPAIVVMPTGSGKSAVIMAASYPLCQERCRI